MIRYLGDYISEVVRHRRLKVAIPSKLNDPFDFSIAPVGAFTGQAALRNNQSRLNDPAFYDRWRELEDPSLTNAQIKELALKNTPAMAQGLVQNQRIIENHFIQEMHSLADESIGLLCFSDESIDNEGDILMWSHYGYSHAGFRLHFDTSFLQVEGIEKEEVDYQTERVSLPIQLTSEDPAFQSAVRKSTYTKGKHWEYENEVRFLINPRLCHHEEVSRMDSIEFPYQALKRIDIGIRSDEKIVVDLHAALSRHQYRHVRLFKAEMHKTDFSIVYKEIDVEQGD
jgi:hypothetical protein